MEDKQELITSFNKNSVRIDLFPDLQKAIEDVADYLKKRAEMPQEGRSHMRPGNPTSM